MLACCARAGETTTLQFSDQDGASLADVIVTLYAADGSPLPFTRAPGTGRVVQRDRAFEPELLVIAPGTRVSFPNEDRVRHHVYSFSPAKTFELELYSGEEAEPVLFDQAGEVVLGCNIHDRMQAWVLVLDTGVHGRSNAEGLASVDLPAGGPFQFRVWHPRLIAPGPVNLGLLPQSDGGALRFTLAVRPPEPKPAPSPLQQRFNRFRSQD